MFDELRELDAVIVDDVKNAELVADGSAGISWRLREVQGGGAADVQKMGVVLGYLRQRCVSEPTLKRR